MERSDSKKTSAPGKGSKLSGAVLAVLTVSLLVSGVSATTISSENITVDLADSRVEADIRVKELTSSNFIYISNTEVSNVNASLNGRELECTAEEIALGSQIECDVDVERNFSVDLEFVAEDITERKGETRVFSFQQPIYRPTENFRLEAILPRGSALKDRENSTQQVISPLNYETGSNGRRISVTWRMKPELGETLSFYILYQSYNPSPSQGSNPIFQLLIALGVLSAALIAGFMGYRRMKTENLEDVYKELSDDEKQVLDLLKENDGEYLQKDLVDEMDYSKAKVSDIVSGLVEREVVEKSKEGRSNKLSITRRYRY